MLNMSDINDIRDLYSRGYKIGKDLIADWLKEDQKHWNKQRHTAKRVYERLKREHGFTGSYETVQRYMKKQNRNLQGRAAQELVWSSRNGEGFTDEQMAAAMIDRLAHHGHLIMFQGQSYRMEHALMRQTTPQTEEIAS